MDTNVLHNLSYGLYIISACNGAFLNAQIANVVFQITSNPPKVAASINKENLTYSFIKKSKEFAVSILEESTPLGFIGKFGFTSGRETDKFKDVNFKRLSSGCPIVLDNAICYFSAEVVEEFDCGSHVLFLARLSETGFIKTGRLMTYEYYHNVKHGTTPQAAPTFLREEIVRKGQKAVQRYCCRVCNYVYNPEAADPDNGIKPNTAFEGLPDNWVCPVCGAGKGQFEKE